MALTISALKIRAVARAMEKLGADSEPVYRLAGLAPRAAVTVETQVALDKYFAVWSTAMQTVRRPVFPAEVARQPVEDLELIGFLVATSSTVRIALEHGIRFQRVWFSSGGWQLDETRPRRPKLVWTPLVEPYRDGLGERCAYESAMVAMLDGIAQLSGTEVACERLDLMHAEPPDAAAMFPSASCREVRFNSKEYALLLPHEVLERSIPKANPPLATYLSEQCELLLRKQHAAMATPVAARVRALLLESLSGGTRSAKWLGTAPIMSRIARDLGMSVRTLRRRLLDEGMHFRALLDDVRAELSVQHLRSGRITVSETAYLLGFESLSAFHRAFRRWTKRTPGAFLPGGGSRGSSE